MKVITEEIQDSLKLKEFIEFCNYHFAGSYNLGGSLCEYFYIKDFRLNRVNDYDIVIDNKKFSIEYLLKLPEVTECRYQGDLFYIGEKKGYQKVYKSNLTLGKHNYTIDWIFGHTTRLIHEVINVEYQGVKSKLTSKDLRIGILKNIATIDQDKSFQNKAKLRLSSYIGKTIL